VGTLRLATWRVPAGLSQRGAVVYGEPLFAEVVAGPLGVALLEAPFDWLPTLPARYRQRAVQFVTLGAARQHTQEAFIKPADEKCFPAQVYTSGAALPGDAVLPAETPVLISEPVTWEVEYRCFKIAKQYTECYHTIVVEDLNLRGLARSRLAKSILDAGRIRLGGDDRIQARVNRRAHTSTILLRAAIKKASARA
jgi:hypothetical protein